MAKTVSLEEEMNKGCESKRVLRAESVEELQTQAVEQVPSSSRVIAVPLPRNNPESQY